MMHESTIHKCIIFFSVSFNNFVNEFIQHLPWSFIPEEELLEILSVSRIRKYLHTFTWVMAFGHRGSHPLPW